MWGPQPRLRDIKRFNSVNPSNYVSTFYVNFGRTLHKRYTKKSPHVQHNTTKHLNIRISTKEESKCYLTKLPHPSIHPVGSIEISPYTTTLISKNEPTLLRQDCLQLQPPNSSYRSFHHKTPDNTWKGRSKNKHGSINTKDTAWLFAIFLITNLREKRVQG